MCPLCKLGELLINTRRPLRWFEKLERQIGHHPEHSA
jgi:hypothetical protein